MSNQGDDDITVVVGSDELSQDLDNTNDESNKMILIIIKKQKDLREEMLKLQGKLEVLNELILEYFVQDDSDDTGSIYEE